MNNEIIIYNSGEIELKVSIDNQNETVWLRQSEISKLFNKERSVITRHINKIFRDEEVDEKSNVQKIHIANSDKPVKFYSLDVILAVGYRTNSKKAIEFRQWATKILKQYITKGYVINSEKITIDRFLNLENDVLNIKKEIKEIKDDKTQIKLTQGVFFNGEVFDAYLFINNLLRDAKKEVILIDNYIDEFVLTIFSKYPNLNFKIITKTISKQLKLDIEKYNLQYQNLTIQTSNKYHDRFLIIDNQTYHIGASLKDLGKKVFGFSKMNINILGELNG